MRVTDAFVEEHAVHCPLLTRVEQAAPASVTVEERGPTRRSSPRPREPHGLDRLRDRRRLTLALRGGDALGA